MIDTTTQLAMLSDALVKIVELGPLATYLGDDREGRAR